MTAVGGSPSGRLRSRLHDSSRHSADASMVPMPDAVHPSPMEDEAMAQHIDHHRRATAEDRQFLEALVFLRGLYGERGPRDRSPVASIAAIIADTERRMRELRFEASA